MRAEYWNYRGPHRKGSEVYMPSLVIGIPGNSTHSLSVTCIQSHNKKARVMQSLHVCASYFSFGIPCVFPCDCLNKTYTCESKDRMHVIFLYFTRINEHTSWLDFAGSGVGVTKPISSVPLFSRFSPLPNRGWLSNITFIFDRCHRSSAVVTPAKYEGDCKNLTNTFARSTIFLTEKSTNGD